MADITAIRKAIAANLGVLPDIQVSAYLLDNPMPPAAHVIPGPVTYDQAMGRGLDNLEFRVQVFVGAVSDIGAQVTLDAYLAGSGALSVKQAIEKVDSTDTPGGVTLGGTVADASVVSHTGPQQFVRGDARLLMCEWTVAVIAHG